MDSTQAFALHGSVTPDNFMRWQHEGEAHILTAAASADGGIRVDLQGLEHSNSLVVALLLAWLRSAATARKSLQFAHSPEELRNIIGFSGLTQLIPLD